MNEREIVELSEFVALRHEPDPVCVSADIFAKSKGGWWEWRDRFGYTTTGYGHFVARSITEPEIAMRLLKGLLADWIVSIDWSSQLKNYEVALDSKSSNDSHIGVGDSLELAIAQAWKKAVESK